MVKLRPEVDAATNRLVELRRDFHRHPELGFQERRTSSIVAAHLEELGFEVQTEVAKTGVVGRMRFGGGGGKRVLVRADMDALPIQEENEVAYRSENDGVMHACGHDGHTAVAMMTASLLAGARDRLRGEVVMMFQPAEEIAGGALPMLDEGLLEKYPVDASLALHLWSPLPTGQVGVRPGPVFAANDSFEIRLDGSGTHCAMPHLGVDTVLMAAKVVEGLQSTLQREVPPVEPYVLSFGSIHGGTAFNIIPEAVTLSGTVRTYDPELRRNMPERFNRVLGGITSAMRGGYQLNYEQVYPTVKNDPAVTAIVRAAACGVVGEAQTIEQEQSMGGEDMAFVLERVPGCYFFVGMGDPDAEKVYPHHHPRFNIDERALPIALEVMLASVERLLDS